MTMSLNRVVERLLAELTLEEQAGGVAYLITSPIPAGTRLEFPRLEIEVPEVAWAAFIDRRPQSDWGHGCRYLLIDDETCEVRSFEAQFPPFRQGSPWQWRVVFKAPTVPDAAVSS